MSLFCTLPGCLSTCCICYCAASRREDSEAKAKIDFSFSQSHPCSPWLSGFLLSFLPFLFRFSTRPYRNTTRLVLIARLVPLSADNFRARTC